MQILGRQAGQGNTSSQAEYLDSQVAQTLLDTGSVRAVELML